MMIFFLLSNSTKSRQKPPARRWRWGGNEMKLTLTLDEVSACAMALLSKAQEAEEEAQRSFSHPSASAAEFWKKRANLYRKTFEAVKAQRASWWEEARRQ